MPIAKPETLIGEDVPVAPTPLLAVATKPVTEDVPASVGAVKLILATPSVPPLTATPVGGSGASNPVSYTHKTQPTNHSV